MLSASDGTDGCAVVGTDLGSAGGPDPGGRVETGTDWVSADLGGAVGTDTGSVEREAALSCSRRSFANKRLKMLGAAVGKLWTTQNARCDACSAGTILHSLHPSNTSAEEGVRRGAVGAATTAKKSSQPGPPRSADTPPLSVLAGTRSDS
jgi:hypothetical protein